MNPRKPTFPFAVGLLASLATLPPPLRGSKRDPGADSLVPKPAHRNPLLDTVQVADDIKGYFCDGKFVAGPPAGTPAPGNCPQCGAPSVVYLGVHRGIRVRQCESCRVKWTQDPSDEKPVAYLHE